jgi:hypothetical protein
MKNFFLKLSALVLTFGAVLLSIQTNFKGQNDNSITPFKAVKADVWITNGELSPADCKAGWLVGEYGQRCCNGGSGCDTGDEWGCEFGVNFCYTSS